jgi:hypothetical protein
VDQQTDDEKRRVYRRIERYSTRQDVAWWPVDPASEPWGADEPFFYRPGQLLVPAAELARVQKRLARLGVEHCPAPRHRDHYRPVERLLVASREPVPVLLRQLSRHGLGPDVVGPNHVLQASELVATPWLSGGGEGEPVEATIPPSPVGGSRGAGVTVAMFDSGLLPDWADGSEARTWLGGVAPARPAGPNGSPDVEGQGGDPDGPDLDIFDSHATFVAGVLTCAAPGATVLVRNVLSELGDVDDDALCSVVRRTLEQAPTVRLVNLSLGGTTWNDAPPLGLTHLVDCEFPAVVFVASAGNNGPAGRPVWPAALPQVVGVGALTPDLPPSPAPFSNVVSADVWAVGEDVVNAFGRGWLDGKQLYASGLAYWSGTSFAAPVVTAVLCEYVHDNPCPSGTGALAWLCDHATTQSGLVIVAA